MDIINIDKRSKCINEYSDLLNYCFATPVEDSHMLLEYADKNCLNILGCIENGLLQASLVNNNFDMFWQGKCVKMGGIGAVSSFPHAREKNYIRDLLKEILLKMHNENQIFSMLDPFYYPFYKKYGWEWAITKKIVEIDINDLSHFEEQDYRMKPINIKQLEKIKILFNNYFSKYNGTIIRPQFRWDNYFERINNKKLFCYGVFDELQELKGVISYTIKDRLLNVEELVYDSLSVKKQLLRFMYKHRAQVDSIIMVVPENDESLLLLKNPRQNVKLKQSMMVRIVDVKRMFEMFDYKGSNDFSFTIKINDRYAPWNDDLFIIRRNNNKIYVDTIINEDININCNIQVLSQIMFGFISWRQAYELEMLDCEDKEVITLLNDIMIKHPTFITEYF